MAETWLDDVIAPSLLQEIDVNKPVSPQLDISWEELLGEAPLVQVLAPSGSANDYPGLLVQEDIDSLLLKASQVFERVNVEGSDELDELSLQASQSHSRRNLSLTLSRFTGVVLHGEESSAAFSRSICVELDSEGFIVSTFH